MESDPGLDSESCSASVASPAFQLQRHRPRLPNLALAAFGILPLSRGWVSQAQHLTALLAVATLPVAAVARARESMGSEPLYFHLTASCMSLAALGTAHPGFSRSTPAPAGGASAVSSRLELRDLWWGFRWARAGAAPYARPGSALCGQVMLTPAPGDPTRYPLEFAATGRWGRVDHRS